MRPRILIQSLLYIGIVLGPFPAAAQEDVETGLEWGCVMEYVAGNQEETERCGLGRYRDLCMWNEGVEECTAVFEFSETPGPSNVLFLPGIKGSRLYDGDDKKLWEPFGDNDIEDLMLDADGKSIQVDIHTKPSDIIDRVAVFTDIYGSFMAFMDTLVSDGTINEWHAFAYDWRLSLPDIVTAAKESGGTGPIPLSAERSALVFELHRLAQNSKSGKVTIVAHSNGGLVAKELMLQLGNEDSARLIDKVILIGVPQSGAPQALGALLYGYKEGIPGIISTRVARAFAQNSPMGYHLLPSASYFRDVDDEDHAVVRFKARLTYAEERSAYGATIDTFDELRLFALAQEGGRTKPNHDETNQAEVLNDTLLTYAENGHSRLDAWTAPPGVSVYQIAGWGQNTVSGIEYFEQCLFSLCREKYRPTFTENGDGVVPVPSALMMSENSHTKKYWLDLREYGFGPIGKKDHGSLLGIEDLQVFIKDIVEKNSGDLPSGIQSEDPDGIPKQSTFRFFLHSPLILELYDENGNRTGPNPDGTLTEEIPGVEYGEFGEVQYLLAPIGPTYQLELRGYEIGTFTLEMQRVEGDAITQSVTFANVPTTASTNVSIEIGLDLSTASDLRVDSNGDEIIDTTIPATLESVTAQEVLLPEPKEIKNKSSRRNQTHPVLSTESVLEELRMKLYSLLLQLLLEYLQESQTI